MATFKRNLACNCSLHVWCIYVALINIKLRHAIGLSGLLKIITSCILWKLKHKNVGVL